MTGDNDACNYTEDSSVTPLSLPLSLMTANFTDANADAPSARGYANDGLQTGSTSINRCVSSTSIDTAGVADLPVNAHLINDKLSYQENGGDDMMRAEEEDKEEFVALRIAFSLCTSTYATTFLDWLFEADT